MTNTIDATQPFLLRFATPRSDEPEPLGHYSAEAEVWVVDTEDGERPIIEIAGDSLAAIQTKTMVHREADDDVNGLGIAMGMTTFTEVKQEADDKDAMFSLPELLTKTAVLQERDDESYAPL